MSNWGQRIQDISAQVQQKTDLIGKLMFPFVSQRFSKMSIRTMVQLWRANLGMLHRSNTACTRAGRSSESKTSNHGGLPARPVEEGVQREDKGR